MFRRLTFPVVAAADGLFDVLAPHSIRLSHPDLLQDMDALPLLSTWHQNLSNGYLSEGFYRLVPSFLAKRGEMMLLYRMQKGLPHVSFLHFVNVVNEYGCEDLVISVQLQQLGEHNHDFFPLRFGVRSKVGVSFQKLFGGELGILAVLFLLLLLWDTTAAAALLLWLARLR